MSKNDGIIFILCLVGALTSWIFDFSSETRTGIAGIAIILVIKNWLDDLIENANIRTQSIKLDLEQIKQVLWRIENKLK